MVERKTSLQRELIMLRKATRSWFTPYESRGEIKRRIIDVVAELTRIDPDAVLYESLGDSRF